MKKLLVGTRAGNIASVARNMWKYLSMPKEQAGTLINDQLALHYVARLCLPNKTFVDVGAHIGSVMSEVARNCPTVSIVAIEPIPEKAAHLRRKFPHAEVHNCVVSESQGEVAFYVDQENSACSSLADNAPNSVAITVKTRRLSEIVSENVDVIKIDVEGAELGVLLGAEKLIVDCRPTIMFESGPGDVLGYTKEKLFAWFADHSYALFVPNRLPHEGIPLSLGGFIEAHCYPFRTLNYFAVAAERLPEIRAQASTIKYPRW